MKTRIFTSGQQKKMWSCQKVCEALNDLLNNIFVNLDLNCTKMKVFQWVLIVLLLLQICFCCFMLSSSDNHQAYAIHVAAFNSNSRYLAD